MDDAEKHLFPAKCSVHFHCADRLAAVFGTDVIPFEITGIPTGRITYGHRFLGDAADISNADDYEE
ncbi:glycine--tRNA ligase subunit beta, partial [Alkalicoccus luteus]|uniref:glycine--tRNA ligase subunit beta n=1 Tax=Alkalicoccus luteus TaxID=1237094 RepID=UPI001FEAD87E